MKRLIWLFVAFLAFYQRSLVLTAEDSDTYLSEEVQEVINEVAEIYCICPELIMAMVEAEASGRVDAESSAGCVGLMQINPKWHAERMERLGVTDLMDAYGNVLVGCDYVAELFHKYGEVNAVLMAYNEGEYGGAVERAYNGEWSKYARSISARSILLEREHGK